MKIVCYKVNNGILDQVILNIQFVILRCQTIRTNDPLETFQIHNQKIFKVCILTFAVTFTETAPRKVKGKGHLVNVVMDLTALVYRTVTVRSKFGFTAACMASGWQILNFRSVVRANGTILVVVTNKHTFEK